MNTEYLTKEEKEEIYNKWKEAIEWAKYIVKTLGHDVTFTSKG